MRLAIVILLLFSTQITGQDQIDPAPPADRLERAVELYDSGKLDESLSAFQSLSRTEPGNKYARFNSLTLQALTQKLNDAEMYLQEHPELSALTPAEKGAAYFNLGTSYLNIAKTRDDADALMQAAAELQNAVKWLQQSLLADPSNQEAKNNLEIANKLMEKLQEQQKQNQDNDQQGENSDKGNKDKDSKEKQDNDDGKDQKDQESNRDKKDQQDQNQQQNQQQPKDKQQQQKSISPEMAKNLLESAKEKEKQALQAIRAMLAKKNKKHSGKDY